MSRDNGKQGANLEAYIQAAHGISLIKVPTPVKLLGPAPALRGGAVRPGIMLARLECPVCVDFVGHLTEGSSRGLAVYLEAKSTSIEAHRTSFGLDDRLAGHQGSRLHEAAASGAMCAVYVRRHGTDAADFLIPFPAGDPRMWDPPRKSWPWEALTSRGWRVPQANSKSWPVAFSHWETYVQLGWSGLPLGTGICENRRTHVEDR